MVYRKRKTTKEVRLRRKANRRFMKLVNPEPFMAAVTPIMYRVSDTVSIIHFGYRAILDDIHGMEIDKIKSLSQVREHFKRHFGISLRPQKISRTKLKKYYLNIQDQETRKANWDRHHILGMTVEALGKNIME